MTSFALTLWRTYSQGRQEKHTWRSFIDTFVREPEIVRDKKSVAGYSLASFQGNRRSLARVEQVFGLVLDIDHGDPTVKKIKRVFDDTRGVIYTTHSHEPEAPRFRVVVPYSRPVDVGEHARIWCWAQQECEKAGLEIDPGARDASHLFFLPSHRPGAEYRYRELEGDVLDVEGPLAQVKRSTHPLLFPNAEAVFASGMKKQRVGIDSTGSGRDWRFALRLASDGVPHDEAVEQLRRFSTSGQGHKESYLSLTVAKARAVYAYNAPRMSVREATLHCMPGRFSYPERRHIELDLSSKDGEVTRAQIIIPAPGYEIAAKTWEACFPDIEPESLLVPWSKVQKPWYRIRWRRRIFEVVSRADGTIRWIRAVLGIEGKR